MGKVCGGRHAILPGRVGGHKTSDRLWARMHHCRRHPESHPLSPHSHPRGRSVQGAPRRKQRADNRRRSAGGRSAASRSLPHRSPVRPPPAPPGGAAARFPSGLDARETLGRALEAELSRGLAALRDGRAAHGAGSPGALAGWRAGLFPWVPCQSLAPRGFLGDVAPPPAQASFRPGGRPWAFARDRGGRCWRSRRASGAGSVSAGGRQGREGRGAGAPTPHPGTAGRFLEDFAGPRERPTPREPG